VRGTVKNRGTEGLQGFEVDKFTALQARREQHFQADRIRNAQELLVTQAKQRFGHFPDILLWLLRVCVCGWVGGGGTYGFY
jgi:hypothetical protein